MQKVFLLPFLFLFLFSWKTVKQENVLTGLLIDKSNNQPLAYVNIGIPGKGIGTVSNEVGRYRLKIPNGTKDQDLVHFSFMG